MKEVYNPYERFLSGFSDKDGTIEFYGRVNSFIKKDSVVVDLGAGRGEWYEDDDCIYRRQMRLLKGKVKQVIGADIGDDVRRNRSTDVNIVLDEKGRLPFSDGSVDVVIADYVLEHVNNPERFVEEIQRVLRPGGLFCGRTPHKFNYVAMGSQIIPNVKHTRVLRYIQPDRKEEDVFPTFYKMNTMYQLRKQFLSFSDYSYIYRGEPSYYFGSKAVHQLQTVLHNILPPSIIGNIFVFKIKNV
jgi:SAM-dependent methyltransferase